MVEFSLRDVRFSFISQRKTLAAPSLTRKRWKVRKGRRICRGNERTGLSKPGLLFATADITVYKSTHKMSLMVAQSKSLNPLFMKDSLSELKTEYSVRTENSDFQTPRSTTRKNPNNILPWKHIDRWTMYKQWFAFQTQPLSWTKTDLKPA